MPRNSGFSCCALVTVFGSTARPQIGHAPGPSRTISGCIGQVHWLLVAATGMSGSSAMPHLGQAPGRGLRTSGSMGHTYVVLDGRGAVLLCSTASAVVILGFALCATYFSGSALNFSPHPRLQK